MQIIWYFLGVVCTFLTFTMNLFINFVPTYSEKQSVVVNTAETDKKEQQQKDQKQQLLPIAEETEGTDNQE